MEFANKIKLRICLMALYAVIGAALWFMWFFGKIQSDTISSIGIALAVCGAVNMARNILLLKNPEKLSEREIAEKDERNIMIWERARSLAFAVYLLLAACAVVALFALGMETAGQIVSGSICGFVAIYLICYLIVRRKY